MRLSLVMSTALFIAIALAAGIGQVYADENVDAAMLRFPDVSGSQIVFVYDNDVWLVPIEGGTAIPISSPPGPELHPKFSPDGARIAYSANYDGNIDVYEISARGGVPTRLTYHPDVDSVVDYAPDGRIIFGSSAQCPFPASKLYYASPEGGLPEALPVAYGATASISSDGKWLAFTPWSNEYRTWNRYRGGTATDIWLFDLKTYASKKITDHPGTDDLPMFHGDKVYYLSDEGKENRRNIWVYDINSDEREQVTHFSEYDVKFPSIGPDDIVFEYGGALYLLGLNDGKTHQVTVSIPGDHPDVRPQMFDVSNLIFSMRISPSAKRVVVEARGDIWTLPAEKGYQRNLTHSDGSAERFPAWSPDGKWIAYFSDRTDEYELYIAPSDSSGAEKQLTKGGKAFRYYPAWSPDSKKIAFSDKTGAYFICIVDTGEIVSVDRDPWAAPYQMGRWAPDSNWFAYDVRDKANANSVVKLFDLANRKSYQVTSPMFSSTDPVFDQSGEYLFYTTQKNFSPTMNEYDDSFVFTGSTQVAVVPLKKDAKSPFAPENDDEVVKKDEAAPGAGQQDQQASQPGDKTENKAITVDLDDFEERAVLLPIARGGYYGFSAGSKRAYYIRNTGQGGQGRTELDMYDLASKTETKLLDGVSGFELTPDGSKMLVNAQGAFFIANASPGAQLDKRVDTSGMRTLIDPKAEWAEIIRDAWRIYRDFFYDPNMHGVDWKKQKERALKLVRHAANRGDVGYILGEMVSELNVGHAYVFTPSDEQTEWLGGGLLGCDYEQAKDENGNAGYSIKKIYDGAPWEPSFRGPLCQPGIDVKTGDFLIAVNGTPIDTRLAPYAAFQGMADKPTLITVGAHAMKDDTSRDYLVVPLGSEAELRKRDWIESNRQYVYDKTGGKVGYIYVRNTSMGGIIDLERQFVGQYKMDALIIDERWNGGGFIPNRLIELLNRPILNYWATRDSENWRTPSLAHAGPKVMLINQAAGSGGDAFPYYFRKVGLGKLVGTRTWGGLVGLSGNPQLIDGGYCSVPTFGIFEVNGTWAIEGHGVDPDVYVIDDPTLLAEGQDPQLDKGIQVILDELKNNAWIDTPKPPYPDRSGAGITPEDK